MTTPRRADRKRQPKPAPVASPAPGRQVITDARAIRALAHPLRVAVLEAVRRDGEITATQAAELLGESPGNMSWHLQTLAKYGFVEESGKGRGRARPWRIASGYTGLRTGPQDDETAAAGEALARTFMDRTNAEMQDWWSRRLAYPAKWRNAAFVSDTVRYLTAAELDSLMEEITAVLDRYLDRQDPQARPAGARPVRVHAHGYPLPLTDAGN